MSRSSECRSSPAFTARLILVVSLLWAASALTTSALATYEIGDTIADFTLNDLTGTPVSLSDYSGDIIVINFFATWCPGCNVEASQLENNIHLAYQQYNVTVLAIDILEDPAIVQDWVTAQAVTYQILLAPDWDLFSSFPKAGGIPYNAVIDADGVLRYAKIMFDQEAIILTLDTLLGLNTVSGQESTFGQLKALFR